MIRDLRDFISVCDHHGMLHRIDAAVDWRLELSHVAKVSEESRGPALLFENVKDSTIPVFTSAFATSERMALCLGEDPRLSIAELSRRWMQRLRREWIAPEVTNDVPVMENVLTGDGIDVTRFPAPWFYPRDGGRYFGTAVYSVCRDPDTGWTNLGTYRMQTQARDAVSVMMLRGKHGQLIRRKYVERGQRMPFAAVIGGDPALFLMGSIQSGVGVSEYEIAGALRGEPVPVFVSELTGLTLPARAEIILEGYLDSEDLRSEGPLGEYTGYYSSTRSSDGAGMEPTLKVERILHRNDPIFWSTTVGKPVNDIHVFQSLNRSATLWHDLETMKIPGIRAVYVPPEACGWFWAVISVKQMYPGHSSQVANAAIGTSTGHYALKGVIVVDEDIDVEDWNQVWWALSTRFDPRRCIQIIDRGRSTPLDPSLPRDSRYIMSRVIMDACTPFEWEDKPVQVFMDRDTLGLVSSRWEEYGFRGENPVAGMIERLSENLDVQQGGE